MISFPLHPKPVRIKVGVWKSGLPVIVSDTPVNLVKRPWGWKVSRKAH
jgi:hypothetical protein